MAFSYQYASEDQIVEHFKKSSRQTIHFIIKYYKELPDGQETLEKILRAKARMKAEKVESKRLEIE